MRRAHMSDEMRSVSCQSGPLSISTTFLPALASTAAKAEPDAPAPAMTTSTFSCVAMSPPPVRLDVSQVGDAETLVALHCAVDDVNGVAAQHEINLAGGRTLPAFDLVLAKLIDEVVLLGSRERREASAVARDARLVHAADRATIEVDEGRLHVNDAGFEERLDCRHRNLMIDEMREARLGRARHQCLAQCSEGLAFLSIEHPERHPARASLARGHQGLDTVDRKGERAHARDLEKDAPLHGVHGFPRFEPAPERRFNPVYGERLTRKEPSRRMPGLLTGADARSRPEPGTSAMRRVIARASPNRESCRVRS